MAVYGTPPGVDKANIDIVSLGDRSRKTLLRGATSARYLRSGHLVYTNRSTMFAVLFDVETSETRGAAVPVLDDVAYDGAAGFAQFDVSRGGTLVYRRASGGGNAMTVQWIDSAGKQAPLQAKPGNYQQPHLSPDGKRLMMVINDGATQDVWVYDRQRDTMTRLTFGGGSFVSPSLESRRTVRRVRILLATACSGPGRTGPVSRECSWPTRAFSSRLLLA